MSETQPTLLDRDTLADVTVPAPERKRTIKTTPPASHDGPVVDVLCDKSGRLGALSYQVPDGMQVAPGDAVKVPFGRVSKIGIVLGEGDPSKATRAISDVFGPRSTPEDIDHARQVAANHFVSFEQIAGRLAPTAGKGANPVEEDTLQFSERAAGAARPAGWADIPDQRTRRYLVRSPATDPAELAALEAARIVNDSSGQVLVLCPSVALVSAVLARFETGARRLDRKADYGAWRGFLAGTVPVGVGTRAAALYAAGKLAGIVVVEEDHPGHVESSQPYTHARDLAISRTFQREAALTLIGMRPTAPALGTKIRVTSVGQDRWPTMTLLDRASYPPEQRLLPSDVIDRARTADREGKPATVLVERMPTVRRCGRCSKRRDCEICEAAQEPVATCTHPAGGCQTCGEQRTWLAGWDAARVQATFDRLGTTVKTATFPELAKRSNIGLLICLDVDRALNRPGFDPDELAAPLLLTAAASVGNAGEVLALTNEPSHPLLTELFDEQDQVAGARRAWQAAKDNGLPPFGHMLTVRCGWSHKPNISRWPGRVLGPRKIGDEWESVVILPPGELGQFGPIAATLRSKGKVRINVQ